MDTPVTPQSNTLTPLYTLADIDKYTIIQLETAKTAYMLNFNSMPITTLIEQSMDIFSQMQMILEKYFAPNMDKSVIEGVKQKSLNGQEYNFYEIKAVLPAINNTNVMRLACEMAFTIYNVFIKQLGVAIPTIHANQKKN